MNNLTAMMEEMILDPALGAANFSNFLDIGSGSDGSSATSNDYVIIYMGCEYYQVRKNNSNENLRVNLLRRRDISKILRLSNLKPQIFLFQFRYCNN